MANEYILRNGFKSFNTSSINGDLTITGQLIGTGSYSINSLTSSYVSSINTTSNYTWTGVNIYSPNVVSSASKAQGVIYSPILSASANNDVLVALDISSSYNTSSFTGLSLLGVRMIGAGAPGKVFGMQIIDNVNVAGNILIGSLLDSSLTFSEPGIWMGGSNVTNASATNYLFNLDDGGAGGAIINGPGTTNHISFRTNNVTRMQIRSGSSNVTVGINMVDDTINNLQVSGSLKAGWFLTKPSSLSAQNTTATLTAAQLIKGVITSTSAATVTLTLPTSTALATALPAVQGTIFDFIIDNGNGANIVTLVAGTGMTVLAIITGSNTLTTAAGSVSIWRLYFKSTTTSVLVRLG